MYLEGYESRAWTVQGKGIYCSTKPTWHWFSQKTLYIDHTPMFQWRITSQLAFPSDDTPWPIYPPIALPTIKFLSHPTTHEKKKDATSWQPTASTKSRNKTELQGYPKSSINQEPQRTTVCKPGIIISTRECPYTYTSSGIWGCKLLESVWGHEV